MWRPFLRGMVAQATKGKAPPFFKSPRGSGTVFPDDCWKGRASGTGEGSHPIQLVDAELPDRPAWRWRGLASAFHVVIVPPLQGLLRNAEKGSRIGNVAETDQTGSLLQEAFGGVGPRGQDRHGGRKEATAVRASVLVRADDQFDGLRAQRKVSDGIRLPASMDGVTSTVAVGT